MTFSDIKDPSHAIASFVVNLKDVDIPGNVRLLGMYHLLDSTGIALASAKFDFAQRTMKAIQGLGGAGAVPVLGMPVSLSPRDAAMMNGFSSTVLILTIRILRASSTLLPVPLPLPYRPASTLVPRVGRC
jgi:2-methylcitrate dehydratase PrpD